MDRPRVKIRLQTIGKLGTAINIVRLTQIIEAFMNQAKLAFTLRCGCHMVLADLRPTALDFVGTYKIPYHLDDVPVETDFKTALFFAPLISVITEHEWNIEEKPGIAPTGPTANRAAIDESDLGARIAYGKTMAG